MNEYTSFSLQCLQRSSEPDASPSVLARYQCSTPSIDRRGWRLVGSRLRVERRSIPR